MASHRPSVGRPTLTMEPHGHMTARPLRTGMGHLDCWSAMRAPRPSTPAPSSTTGPFPARWPSRSSNWRSAGYDVLCGRQSWWHPASIHTYFAVQMNWRQWYVSATELTQAIGNAVTTRTMTFDPTASAWNQLTVTGTGSIRTDAIDARHWQCCNGRPYRLYHGRWSGDCV